MTNVYEEIGAQCCYTKNEDQTHIEIRTDFIRAVIVDTSKFFMV